MPNAILVLRTLPTVSVVRVAAIIRTLNLLTSFAPLILLTTANQNVSLLQARYDLHPDFTRKLHPHLKNRRTAAKQMS